MLKFTVVSKHWLVCCFVIPYADILGFNWAKLCVSQEKCTGHNPVNGVLCGIKTKYNSKNTAVEIPNQITIPPRGIPRECTSQRTSGCPLVNFLHTIQITKQKCYIHKLTKKNFTLYTYFTRISPTVEHTDTHILTYITRCPALFSLQCKSHNIDVTVHSLLCHSNSTKIVSQLSAVNLWHNPFNDLLFSHSARQDVFLSLTFTNLKQNYSDIARGYEDKARGRERKDCR